MHTRSVDTDEIDLFVGAAGTPGHRREVEKYLKSMFAAGSMRPEWCFVAEDGDRLRADGVGEVRGEAYVVDLVAARA